MKKIKISESKLFSFLFNDVRFSYFWLIIRVYVGYEWLMAGWEKLGNPVWTGNGAGNAIRGFLMGALQKTVGEHPDVSGWYAYFINHMVLPHALFFSYLITYGEIIIGIALIIGLFTGIFASIGAFMNLNYLFAGTLSINPLMLILQFFIILAWRTAGWLGADHYLLTTFNTSWRTEKT